VFHDAGPAADVEPTCRAIDSVWLPQSSVAPDEFVAVDHDILIKIHPRA
jgi:hypothetical protein